MGEPVPPSEPISNRGVENRYLGLLTTYNVPWDNEKTARDVWQNFFDGQGGTLDGVTNTQTETEDGVQVSISGSGDYDYSHLMHMGGGTKSLEDDSVGGYREGAKVAALIMLTRMGADQVVHESDDWKLTYYLNDVPDYRIGDQPTKGLYARVEKVPFQAGSRFSVKFPDPSVAKEFIEARNLFYSSENPDFQDPTFDNPEVGGFKLHKGEHGNIYEAGQRRPFIGYRSSTRSDGGNAGEYNALPDITLWTKGKVFDADRDRGAVTERQINQRVLGRIVSGMSEEDIRKIIRDNSGFWSGTNKLAIPEFSKLVNPEAMEEPDPEKMNAHEIMESIHHTVYELTLPGRLLTQMSDTYNEKYHGQKWEFPSQYLAFNGPHDYIAPMESVGYIICHPEMETFGMTTTQEAVIKLMELFRVEPSEAEKIRIGLLMEFTRDIIGMEESPQIWMFNAKKEKTFFHGHYTPEFLWESQEQIHQDFSTALRTYLHEISHGRAMNTGHDTEFVGEFGLLCNIAMLNLEGAILDPESEDSKKVRQILEKWKETKSSLEPLNE